MRLKKIIAIVLTTLLISLNDALQIPKVPLSNPRFEIGDLNPIPSDSPTTPDFKNPNDKRLMKPVIPANRRKRFEDSIKPSKEHVVYLTDGNELIDEKIPAINGALNIKTNVWAVNLNEVDDITNIVCHSQMRGSNKETYIFLELTFKNAKSRDKAIEAWAMVLSRSLFGRSTMFDKGNVFIDAYGEGCGAPEEVKFLQIKERKWDTIGDSGLAISIESALKRDTVDKIQEKVINKIEVAWGKDHEEMVENLRDQQGPQKRAETSQQDLEFAGRWPRAGSYPMVVNSTKTLETRTIRSGWGWVGWDEKMDIQWPPIDAPGKTKSPWTKNDGLPESEQRSEWDDEKLKGYRMVPFSTGGNDGIWCVECEIKGQIATSGAVGWSHRYGWHTEAKLSMDKTRVAAYLGIRYFDTLAMKDWAALTEKGMDLGRQNLWKYSIPISPMAIGSLFVIGPSVSVGPYVKTGLSTSGSVLFGGELEWENAEISINYNSRRRFSKDVFRATGWQPDAKYRYQAEADIAAEASAGLRFTFDFGITSCLMTNTIGLSLIDEVGFFARTGIPVRTVLEKYQRDEEVRTTTGDNECVGIKTKIGFRNRLYFQAGRGPVAGVWQYDLINPEEMSWVHPSMTWCWKFEDIKKIFESKPSCLSDAACYKNAAV